MKNITKSTPYSKRKPARGWPPERRKAQAERIRKIRPWLKATGPRTAEGKARSSKNAITHGGRTAQMNEIRRFLRWQAQFLKKVWEQINDRTSLRNKPFLAITTQAKDSHETHLYRRDRHGHRLQVSSRGRGQEIPD